MPFRRLLEGLHRIALVSLFAGIAGGACAADFPFGRELLLDAAPIRPGKRMPSITITANGAATIDLWCKTVGGKADISDEAIRIEADPLPDALPQWQSKGQCTPERMQADETMLSALSQVTGWKRQNGTLVLLGPTPMKFRAASN